MRVDFAMWLESLASGARFRRAAGPCEPRRAMRLGLFLPVLLLACGDDPPATPAPAGPNNTPSLLGQRPDPATPLVLATVGGIGGETVELDLSDPDRADRLFLRMFVDYDRPNHQLYRQTTSPPPGVAGTVRTVAFRNLSCADVGIDDSVVTADGGVPGQHVLEIVVSDRDFDDGMGAPVNRRPMPDAFTVVATWPFVCR